MSIYTEDIRNLSIEGLIRQARSLTHTIADPYQPATERREAEQHLTDNAYAYIHALLHRLDHISQER
ncbi:hypothetical protein [Actinomyces procaprae]|uniref:hypothetical protein n=1 Tax=Actinomyces procaprae TaxID=2560010 RepID=UPI0010A28946|nr:hypothetical protein [Actinomyces procaprae]